MRILVTRLRFLGDIVLTTPLLDALREAVPDARIEYLAAAPFADVLRGHPSVDRLHVLPARPTVADLIGMVRSLREGERFDWAIDLFCNPRSAVLVGLSGARQRVGSARGLRARVYQHRRGQPAGDRSAIRYHLDRLVPMLGEAPAPRLPRLVVDPERAQALLESLDLRPGPFSLVHPGSTWPDKAWPEDRWPELMRGLDAEKTGPLLVVRPPGAVGMAEEVAAAGGGRLLPALSIEDLSLLLSRAGLFVGNDGGVLHMAVAHQVPTVGLFGPTEPDIWFPYEQWGPYRVVHGCAPERIDAAGVKQSRLGPVTVEQVRDAVFEVLDPANAEARG